MAAPMQKWHRSHQHFGVFGLGIREHLFNRSLFHQFALRHDQDMSAQVISLAKVMRNEQDAHVMLLAQIHQQVKHSHPQRGSEHAGRFISNQQFGANHQGAQSSLAAPARQRVDAATQRGALHVCAGAELNFHFHSDTFLGQRFAHFVEQVHIYVEARQDAVGNQVAGKLSIAMQLTFGTRRAPLRYFT